MLRRARSPDFLSKASRCGDNVNHSNNTNNDDHNRTYNEKFGREVVVIEEEPPPPPERPAQMKSYGRYPWPHLPQGEVIVSVGEFKTGEEKEDIEHDTYDLQSHMMLPVIEENCELNLRNVVAMGGIEVESTFDEGRVIDRIICMPLEYVVEVQMDEDRTELVLEHDGLEVTPTIIESILQGCSCFNPPKSVLRGDDHDSRSRVQIPDRAVSFSSLEINEFGMTLGDHPSAVSGPPVALDWEKPAKRSVVEVDEYERMRSPRRKRAQLKLSYQTRKGILEQQKGFSETEVHEAWAEALRIRRQRQETLKRGLILMMWDDMWESTQRKYRRLADSLGL